MKREKKMYVRLTRGLNHVGTLIPKNDNPFNYIENFDEDYYLSLYEYTEEQKKQAEEIILVEDAVKGSYKRARGVSGINNVVTDCLAFDFDSTDLNLAQKDTITLVDRLIESGVDKKAIKVSFSGNKGFSVIVNHNTELTPEKHKQIAKSLAGDLETFDVKIYNASRIFRLDYTKHGQTNLYKTPLDISALKSLNVDSIKKQAQKKKIPNYNVVATELPKSLLELKEKEIPKSLVDLNINEEIDFSQKPSFLSKAKYVLQKGHIPEGYGNTAFMILAATYKKAGLDKNDAFNMLWSVNEKRTAIYGDSKKRTEDEIMTQVVDVVYGPNWQGGTYSEKDNELLASINEKYNVKEDEIRDKKLVYLNDVTSIFKNFAENIDKNTIKIGIKSIDENVRMTTSMLVELLAAPSAGKSSITFGILESLSSRNIDSMFLSLDMGAPLVYQRLVQRALGFSGDKIFNAYKNKETGTILQIERSVNDNYKNVSFCFKSGITVSDIRLMLDEERKNGRNIKFLAIDYLECLQGPYSDPTANKGFLAQQLKDIANDFELCLFLLVQPQKHAGDPSDELNSYRLVKGSSVLEEQASIILSMHRPGFDPQHPEDDNFLNITVLKNRMGQLGSYDFNWDGLRGSITEMTTEDKTTLKTLREQVLVRKKAKDEKPF
jgi:replicative DNA helicase